MFIGIASEVMDAKSKKQEQDKVVAQNTALLGKIENLNDQNKELIDGKDKVVAQNTDLLEKIGTYQQNLQEKEKKIKELEKKAKMSARNVTSMYDFNGAKRQTSGGKINVVAGEEFGIFQQMIEFAKAKDLPNLIKLCEKQIEKTPDWYTPYFYLGMAQADMGLKDEAIKIFGMQLIIHRETLNIQKPVKFLKD